MRGSYLVSRGQPLLLQLMIFGEDTCPQFQLSPVFSFQKVFSPDLYASASASSFVWLEQAKSRWVRTIL